MLMDEKHPRGVISASINKKKRSNLKTNESAEFERFNDMYEHRFPAPIPRELGRGQFKSTDPWSIIFTSGTTGLPKAAGLTHWSTMKMNTTKLMLGMKPGDVAYSGLPLYHAYASQLGKAYSYRLVRRF